jgi:hypothetical protein
MEVYGMCCDKRVVDIILMEVYGMCCDKRIVDKQIKNLIFI